MSRYCHFLGSVLLLPLAYSHSVLAQGRAAPPIAAPPAAIAQSTDHALLEKVAASLEGATEFAATLKPPLAPNQPPSSLRAQAYFRLGEIGTPEALTAILRVEAKAAKVNLIPATVPLGSEKPLATAKTPDNTTYAIFSTMLFGGQDFVLTYTKTPDDPKSWTRPVLLPIPSQSGYKVKLPQMTFQAPDAIKFDYTFVNSGTQGNPAPLPEPKTFSFSLAEVLRDTDKDGWTDIEEARLGLDSKKADTDGDGIPDGQDTCPDFARPVGADIDPNSQILERAAFAALAFRDDRTVLALDPKTPKFQIIGYPGPILINHHLPAENTFDSFPCIHRLSFTCQVSENKATVSIRDYWGPMASTWKDVLLWKPYDQWVVTGIRAMGGS